MTSPHRPAGKGVRNGHWPAADVNIAGRMYTAQCPEHVAALFTALTHPPQEEDDPHTAAIDIGLAHLFDEDTASELRGRVADSADPLDACSLLDGLLMIVETFRQLVDPWAPAERAAP